VFVAPQTTDFLMDWGDRRGKERFPEAAPLLQPEAPACGAPVVWPAPGIGRVPRRWALHPLHRQRPAFP